MSLDPLDPATVENGCLWMIPGSHLHGRLPCFEDRGRLDRLYTDVDRALPGAERVPIEAPAGSVIFFDGDVVHGSRGNRTPGSRRAFVLTYQPAGFASTPARSSLETSMATRCPTWPFTRTPWPAGPGPAS